MNKKEFIRLFFKKKEKNIFIIDYIEKNSDKLKEIFLNSINKFENLNFFGKKLKEQFEVSGHYNLWDMSLIKEKNPYKTEAIFQAIKYFAILKILSDYKNIKKVHFVNFDKNFTSIIKNSSKIKNINKVYFDSVSINIYFKNKFINLIKSSFFLGQLFFIYYILRLFKFKKIKKNNFFNNKIIILNYFTQYDKKKFASGKFISDKWLNIKKIFKKIDWLNIFLPNEDFRNYNSLDQFLAKNKNSISFYSFINSYLNIKIILLIFRDYYKCILIFFLIRIKIFLRKDSEAYDFYQIFKIDFFKSFKGYYALENLLYIHLFDRFFSLIPHQPLGLYLLENQPWEKAFLNSWKKYNHGKLVGYVHTTINYWHLNYFESKKAYQNNYGVFKKFLPDYIFTHSQQSKNFLIKQGIKRNICHTVEVLRYNRNLNIYKNFNTSNYIRKILIVGDYESKFNDNFLKVVSDFIKHKNNLDYKFDFYFKPHPSNKILYNSFFLDEVKIVTDNIDKIVNNFYLILCANSTSASIEALQYGAKLLIYYDDSQFDLSPFKKTDINYKNYTFSNASKLIKLINKKKFLFTRKKYFKYSEHFNLWKKFINQIKLK